MTPQQRQTIKHIIIQKLNDLLSYERIMIKRSEDEDQRDHYYDLSEQTKGEVLDLLDMLSKEN